MIIIRSDFFIFLSSLVPTVESRLSNDFQHALKDRKERALIRLCNS